MHPGRLHALHFFANRYLNYEYTRLVDEPTPRYRHHQHSNGCPDIILPIRRNNGYNVKEKEKENSIKKSTRLILERKIPLFQIFIVQFFLFSRRRGALDFGPLGRFNSAAGLIGRRDYRTRFGAVDTDPGPLRRDMIGDTRPVKRITPPERAVHPNKRAAASSTSYLNAAAPPRPPKHLPSSSKVASSRPLALFCSFSASACRSLPLPSSSSSSSSYFFILIPFSFFHKG